MVILAFTARLGERRTYSDLVGPETAHKYQTFVYLAGSASAEFFADIGLCPFEAVKVLPPRPPSHPLPASPTFRGLPFVVREGLKISHGFLMFHTNVMKV